MAELIRSTMLIERTLGVLAYCLVVALGVYFIMRKKVVLGLNICLVLIGILAFFYVPSESADLFRIRDMTKNWGKMPFSTFMSQKFFAKEYPLGLLLYYLTAQIGVAGLLPAFAALVFFGNAFHIFKTLDGENRNAYAAKYNYNAVAIAFLLFMCSGAFLEVVSGIRSFMAFSIVMRFAFDEIKEKRICFIYLPFYVVASLIHPAALALSVIWILYSVYRSYKLSKRQFIFNIVFVAVCVLVAVIVGRRYVFAVFDKLKEFITGEIYSYIWEYLIGAMQMVLYVYLINKYVTAKVKKRQIDDFMIFPIIISVMVICMCFEYNTFHRFITALSFFMIPVSVATCNKNDVCLYGFRKGVNLKFVCYLALFVLLTACVRGNLCAYKFMVLG